MEVRVQRAASEAWCPYCRDRVDEGRLQVCPACHATYHPDCAQELGRCAALGCGGEPRELEVVEPTRSRWFQVMEVWVTRVEIGFYGAMGLGVFVWIGSRVCRQLAHHLFGV